MTYFSRAQKLIEMFNPPERLPHISKEMNSGGRIDYKAMKIFNGNVYDFELELYPSGLLEVEFYRNNSTINFYRDERSKEDIRGDTNELRKVVGTLAYMIDQVMKTGAVNIIQFSASESKVTNKLRLYRRFAQVLARKYKGTVNSSSNNDIRIYLAPRSRTQGFGESFTSGGYDPNKLRITNSHLRGGTLYQFKTMIGGEEASFEMTERNRVLEIVFHFKGYAYKKHKSTSVEDIQNIRQMFGIVTKMLDDVYYENYRDIGAIKFSADVLNPSRVRLYDRFARMIAFKLGGPETQIKRRFDGENIVFTIILPSAFDREGEGYV